MTIDIERIAMIERGGNQGEQAGKQWWNAFVISIARNKKHGNETERSKQNMTFNTHHSSLVAAGLPVQKFRAMSANRHYL
jgi:hypothetical protein